MICKEQLKPGAIEETQLSNFRAEMQLLRELTPHQNIIQVLGTCVENDENLCIVTPYYENGSLYKYLRSSVEISKTQILKWLTGIAAG